MNTNLSLLAPYCYEALEPCAEDDPIIRLLELRPRATDTTTIRLRLETYRIRSAPPYECLSYCWGSTGGDEIIECNGAALSVTKSLHIALSYLQNDIGGPSRLLWIDQIAINQDDNIEKSQQVGIMRVIYEQAYKTVAWLGESRNDSDQAVDFLYKQQTHLLEGTDFPNSITFNDLFSEHSERLKCFITPSREEALALVHLLRRPWFRRCWVIQEAATSKQLIVKCGVREISFEALFAMFCLSMLTSSILKLGRCDYVHDLFALMDIRARAHVGKKEQQSRFLPMSNLLRLSQRCGATDARDKLIALYGITSSNLSERGLRPDYTISATDLFIKATFVMLQDDNTLRILEAPRSNSATMPGLPFWVPDWSDTARQERDLNNYLESDGPDVEHAMSFVEDELYGSISTDVEEDDRDSTSTSTAKPDLNKMDSAGSVGEPSSEDNATADAATEYEHSKAKPIEPAMTRKFDATQGSTPTNLQLSPDNLLGLSGHIIDKITDVSEVLIAPDVDPDSVDTFVEEEVDHFSIVNLKPILHKIYDRGVRKLADYVRTFKDWEIMALKNEPTTYPNGEPRSRAYWKTLCIGYYEGGRLRTTEEEAEKLYYRWRKSFSTVFIGRMIPLGSSLTTLMGTFWSSRFDGVNQQTFANLTEYTLQRRLAKTSRGYLALLPRGAMKGDIVALLRGGRVPFVLRPAGGSWQLIGASYVHGAMFGELWDEDSCADIWLQ